MRFGNLIVRRPAPDIIKPSGRIYPSWYCDCDCGTKDYVTTTEKLRSGKYKRNDVEGHGRGKYYCPCGKKGFGKLRSFFRDQGLTFCCA